MQLMKTIYQSAREVLIWLGRSDTKSCTAFDFIRSHSHLSISEYQQCMEVKREDYAAAFDGLCNLLKRRWFTRVWTLQEFAFASAPHGPLIICGQDHLHWALFYVIGWRDSELRRWCLEGTHSSPLSAHFQKAQEYWSIVSTMEDIRRDIPHGYHLNYLLQATTHYAASDSRDRIYALLGFAEKVYQQKLIPDYSKTVTEVYVEAVKCIVETDRSLNILAFPASKKNLDDLPSWTPDFSISLSTHSRALLPRDLEKPRLKALLPPELWAQYRVSGLGSRPTFRFSEDRKCLSVRGIQFGRVDEVVGPFNSLESYLQQAKQCAERAVLKPLPRGHLCNVLHRVFRPRSSLWRAFVADKDENGRVPAPAAYKGIVKAMQRGSLVPTSSRTAGPRSKSNHLAPLQRSLGAAIENRRFFRTDNGFVGIGPDKIQKGDVVGILFGADVPFILQSDGVFHTLVGAAYVHGIMAGGVGLIYREFGGLVRTFRLH